jgi:hypothetical protein
MPHSVSDKFSYAFLTEKNRSFPSDDSVGADFTAVSERDSPEVSNVISVRHVKDTTTRVVRRMLHSYL